MSRLSQEPYDEKTNSQSLFDVSGDIRHFLRKTYGLAYDTQLDIQETSKKHYDKT